MGGVGGPSIYCFSSLPGSHHRFACRSTEGYQPSRWSLPLPVRNLVTASSAKYIYLLLGSIDSPSLFRENPPLRKFDEAPGADTH